jgi:hypothetical protein
MVEVWIILTLLGGILAGWLARSYLGNQFIKEFHAMHDAGHPVEQAVERANAHIDEQQKYVAWGLGLFITSFVVVVVALKEGTAEDTQLTNSFKQVEQNPVDTREGVTDAMKQLGFPGNK